MRHDPERFVTFVLGAFVFLYYLATAARAASFRRRNGRSPVSAAPGGGGRAAAAIALSWPLPILAWAHCPECFGGLPRVAVLENWPVRLLGVLLLSLASAVIAVAWSELGDRWRVGVDAQDREDFVRTGIYSSIRHPVYGGFWLALLGFFLLAPNLMFALLWAAGSTAISVQAEREERHLAALHGKAYRDYMATTGRFFPLWY